MGPLIHDRLEETASTTPHQIAVVDGGTTLTYRELDDRSNQLANLLIERGASRGDRIGLQLDKSAGAIVGIYAALKCGCAYVPIDPLSPPSRLGYIARNCEIRHIVTSTEKAPVWVSLVSAGVPVRTMVVLNSAVDGLPHSRRRLRMVGRNSLDAMPTDRPDVPSSSSDLAYVLYTSGSTGAPKGVKLSHHNALAFVDWAVDTFDVTAQDTLSNHAPLNFDLSVFDLFAAATAGARLVLVPPKISVFPVNLVRFIDSNGITIWYSVPSILSMITQRGGLTGGELPELRTILFAGEVFPTKYLKELMGFLPHVRFSNLYGPTETNVCTYYDVPLLPEDYTEPIPIGRAIAGVDPLVMGDDGRPVARGEVGELYVKGPTVMQGYWGDDEKTARSLVAVPGVLGDGEVAYRTGDLMWEGDDGDLRLVGRRDSQVKSRGYRIELGEIESALYADPSVVECAVVAIPDEIISNRLHAFAVVRGDVDEPALLRACAERLPRYMVPHKLEIRQSLPKTSTGKVDRQALTRQATTPAPAR